ncbi:TfoX/Sxy family protein [Aestuariivita boseongensis]|uniref:TfoX/Sxy family protein n=1 Tax=Aestuariivita boseongensis TaxID=1470562 RepID=UPI0006813FA1|nr:TfoX/Sxy family protein [Aestuariivita boseongensis]
MAVSDEQIAFVTDLFSDLGPVTTRKMFGGLGIYAGDTIFAILMSDGSLKLKGAGNMPAAFEQAGWAPWTYTRKDGAASSMPYWTMPEDLLDDPDAACDWARRALADL